MMIYSGGGGRGGLKWSSRERETRMWVRTRNMKSCGGCGDAAAFILNSIHHLVLLSFFFFHNGTMIFHLHSHQCLALHAGQ